jgi:aromatic-L-amino-acid decarboxylase
MSVKKSSLDPEDWNELKDIAHRMVDDLFHHLSSLRQQKPWNSQPAQILNTFSDSAPTEGQPLEQIYNEFRENILSFPYGNLHPRFMAFAVGAGSPIGALAEFLKGGMNSMSVGYDNAAVSVEHQVLDWMKALLGYPTHSSGILVSGGSEANLIALNVARNAKATSDIKRQGVGGSRRMLAYCSKGTHFSVRRALEVLGLGNEALIEIPLSQNFAMDCEFLRSQIEADLKSGHQPFAIIGNAGTAGTGTIDPLKELSSLAKEFDLWFHVDGAIGAVAIVSDQIKPLLEGMEFADSISFDLHKWMQIPYGVGCVLIRSSDLHRSTFEFQASYLVKRGQHTFADFGIELSREFRALKVWMSLKAYGLNGHRDVIEKSLQQARHLTNRIDRENELELMAPTTLNIVTFRYKSSQTETIDLNSINDGIIEGLRAEGLAIISSESHNGQKFLRVCIMNHRTANSDIDFLVDNVLAKGRSLAN